MTAKEKPMLSGATKDRASTNADWEIRRDLIADVGVKEIRSMVTGNGVTTEIYRADWGVGKSSIGHAIHVTLRGNAISAWHCHEFQNDHIAVVHGAMRLVLFDDRESSITRGKLNVFNLSPLRPMLIAIPPGVWHGLRNLMFEPSTFVNLFDRAYRYDDPDEWRLPADTDQIPYRF
jgi:dTDP-4-dehydrorhamnose 3,5-epimerase